MNRITILLFVLSFLCTNNPILSQPKECTTCNDGNPCTKDICLYDTVLTGGWKFRGCRNENICNTWYKDSDGDGYYSATRQAGSSPGIGWSLSPGSGANDCNDVNASINPGQAEICGNNIDENCDGSLSASNNNPPTEQNLVVNITNPSSIGCRGKVTISYSYDGCWSSYEGTLSDNPDFYGLLEGVVSGTHENNNLEFLSDGQGYKTGTYYVRLVDNNGFELYKTIKITEPTEYDKNANITYSISPPDVNSCLFLLKIKLNTTDCFDQWYTTLKAYSSDGTKSTIVLFKQTDLKGYAPMGEEIVYQFPLSPIYSIFRIESTYYNSGSEADYFVPDQNVEDIMSYIECDSDPQINIIKSATSHCSSDGQVEITLSTQNPCINKMVIYLITERLNPYSKWEFQTENIEFSKSKTVSFTNLPAGNYVASIGYQGPNYPLCRSAKTFTISTENNIASLSFAATAKKTRCYESKDGSITASVTGGSPPYTYLWSDGQTGITATNLHIGYYFLTVTDALGCSITNKNTPDEAFIVAPENPPAEINISKTNVTTPGGNDGTATVSASSPTGPFTFIWVKRPPMVAHNTRSSTATGLSKGDYKVFIKDQRGCSQSEIITILGPPPSPKSNIENSVTSYNSGPEMTIQKNQIPKGEVSKKRMAFPNPANDKIHLFINGQPLGNITIGILDISGRLVKRFNQSFSQKEQQITINTNDIADGMYFILITDVKGKPKYHNKLLVQH